MQTAGLKTLLLNGQNRIKPIANYMPPVARGWTSGQFAALNRYLKQNIYKGSSSGG